MTQDNYAEYKASPNGKWRPSVYCVDCIEQHFINGQWQKYIELIEKADCAAALKRVITTPPPLHVKDAGYKCEEEQNPTGEVYKFWYAKDNQEHSSELKGCLQGEARDKFWAEKKEYMHAMELAEQADAKNQKK